MRIKLSVLFSILLFTGVSAAPVEDGGNGSRWVQSLTYSGSSETDSPTGGYLVWMGQAIASWPEGSGGGVRVGDYVYSEGAYREHVKSRQVTTYTAGVTRVYVPPAPGTPSTPGNPGTPSIPGNPGLPGNTISAGGADLVSSDGAIQNPNYNTPDTRVYFPDYN